MQQAEPGWFADPYDPSLERAWDGSAWTNETRIPPATASGALGATSWGAVPDVSRAQAPTWSPPSAPEPELIGAIHPASAPIWRRVGVVVSALALFVIGFAVGFTARRSDDARVTARAITNTPVAGSEPANVNVPGPTAPSGVDTAGIIAEENLGMAANAITIFLHARPGLPITQQILDATDTRFEFDLPGTPIGDPGTVGGPAVISAGIDHLPGAPRRVVLALPGNSACYYALITESGVKYGVAHGADAASHCFVSETAGGVPQVRPETKWTDRWPPPTS